LNPDPATRVRGALPSSLVQHSCFEAINALASILLRAFVAHSRRHIDNRVTYRTADWINGMPHTIAGGATLSQRRGWSGHVDFAANGIGRPGCCHHHRRGYPRARRLPRTANGCISLVFKVSRASPSRPRTLVC